MVLFNKQARRHQAEAIRRAGDENARHRTPFLITSMSAQLGLVSLACVRAFPSLRKRPALQPARRDHRSLTCAAGTHSSGAGDEQYPHAAVMLPRVIMP